MFARKRKKNRLQLHQVTQRIGRRRNSQVNTRYQGLLKKWLSDLDEIEMTPQDKHQLSIKARIIKIGTR